MIAIKRPPLSIVGRYRPGLRYQKPHGARMGTVPKATSYGPLTGLEVRLTARHERGPCLATLTGTYLDRGAYYAYIPSLKLYSVARPGEWEDV